MWLPLVAGKAWRSEGGTAAKGNHLAALMSLARSLGKDVGGEREPCSTGLEIVITQRISKLVEWHAGVGLDVLVINAESGLDSFGKGTQDCGLPRVGFPSVLP